MYRAMGGRLLLPQVPCKVVARGRHFSRYHFGVRNPSISYSSDRDKIETEKSVKATEQIYFATCHPGLEEVLSFEVLNLQGAENVRPGKAGVYFEGNRDVMFSANLWLRTAIRVLELVTEVDLDPRQPAGDTLYEAFRDAIDWPHWLHSPQLSFSIESRIWGNSTFSNSQLLNVRAKDAICDSIRDARGEKPMPPSPGRIADVPLFATAFQDKLSIYLDSSGASLHKRGYAPKKHRAALNECAAAGCLYLAGFPDLLKQGRVILADPMCGSGTLLIEAALIAGNIAPGLYRRWWPFLSWPGIDRRSWTDTVEKAKQLRAKDKPNVLLLGNDIHDGALDIAMKDVKAAGVTPLVGLRHGNCQDWRLQEAPSLVITNPPWGQRLGYDSSTDSISSVSDSWRSLGDFLKREAPGTDAYVLSGSSKTTQDLRLKASRRIPLKIGGIDCRLLQYSIHAQKVHEKKYDSDI